MSPEEQSLKTSTLLEPRSLQLGKLTSWSQTPSWGCVSAIDRDGRTIWIVDAHHDYGKRFVVRADEKLTAFMGKILLIVGNTISRAIERCIIALLREKPMDEAISVFNKS